MGNHASNIAKDKDSVLQRPKSLKLPADSIAAPPETIIEIDAVLLSDKQCYRRFVENLRQYGFAILRMDAKQAEYLKNFFIVVSHFFSQPMDHKQAYEWNTAHCIGHFAVEDGETFQFKLPGAGVRLAWPPAPYDPGNQGLVAYIKKMQEIGLLCVDAIEKVVLDKHEHTIRETLDFDPVPANTFGASMLTCHMHRNRRMCAAADKVAAMLRVAPVVPVPGTQIFNEAMNKWLDIESNLRPFTDVIVTVGSDLELISNGYFKAPSVRVVSLTDERLSLPFALRPRPGFEDRYKTGIPIMRQSSLTSSTSH